LLSPENPLALYGRGAQLQSPQRLAEREAATGRLVQLSEVLDGADHLRGVGVLVWRKTPCPKMNPSTDEDPAFPFPKALFSVQTGSF